MKKKGIDRELIIRLMYPLGVIVVILGFLAVRFVTEKVTGKDTTYYCLICLNSDKNTVSSDEAYFFSYQSKTYCYDFETGVTEQLCELDFDFIGSTGSSRARSFGVAVYEDYGFYVEDCYKMSSNYYYAIHRYNYRTKEDEILLEDIKNLCGISICNGYLIYRPDHSSYYLYPATAPAGEEPIDLASIFEQEGDKTNPDIQTVTYEGMDIGGYFAGVTGEADIVCVREHGTGKELIPLDDRFFLNDGRCLNCFSNGAQQYCARIYDNNEMEEYEITCLSGKDINVTPEFYEKYMTQEGDEIICLLQTGYVFDGVASWEKNSGGDILFKWNIKTGESSILYETLNGNTRIIGYKDGNIYLLHNYWVSVQSVDDGKRKKLFKIPKRRAIYYFDWQGDYLIVTDIYGEDEVLKAYKIE